MFKKQTAPRRLLELEAENIRLTAENERLHADLDYLAMETDVDLDEEVTDDEQ